MRALPLLLAAFLALPASAATFTVTKTADTSDGACDADCSLREAIAAAEAMPDFDTIVFAPSLAGQTITLVLGELFVGQSVRIDGEELGITVSGNDASRVFLIGIYNGYEPTVGLVGLTITRGHTTDCGFCDSGGAGINIKRGTVTLERCIVEGNTTEGIFGDGGGIIISQGALTLDRCIVRNNTAEGGGGGLAVGRPTSIRNSTIAGNTSRAGGGGGIFVYTSGSLFIENTTITENVALDYEGGGIAIYALSDASTITNSTITRNEADDWGGGLRLGGKEDLYVANSIVAGNNGNGFDDCGPGIISRGGNVFGTGGGCAITSNDAAVTPTSVFTLILHPDLTDNGGPTPTYALRYRDDNPALGLGRTCGPTDQRGVPAPLDGPDPDAEAACDAGAVEADTPDLAVALTPEGGPVVTVPASGGPVTFTATLTNESAQTQSFQAWARAALPSGATTRVLLGPVTVTLQPGQSVTRTLTQQVPGNAPAGEYAYMVYVGSYPDGAVDGASFAVVKEGALGRMAAVEGAAWPAAGWADEVPVAASVSGLPEASVLHAAHPNPFASRSTFSYDLPAASRVRLAVYDVLGREVAVVVDAERAAGRHEAVFDGSSLPSGTYLVRLEASGTVETRRVTLVR